MFLCTWDSKYRGAARKMQLIEVGRKHLGSKLVNLIPPRKMMERGKGILLSLKTIKQKTYHNSAQNHNDCIPPNLYRLQHILLFSKNNHSTAGIVPCWQDPTDRLGPEATFWKAYWLLCGILQYGFINKGSMRTSFL